MRDGVVILPWVRSHKARGGLICRAVGALRTVTLGGGTGERLAPARMAHQARLPALSASGAGARTEPAGAVFALY